jgi:hypothetical protein
MEALHARLTENLEDHKKSSHGSAKSEGTYEGVRFAPGAPPGGHSSLMS